MTRRKYKQPLIFRDTEIDWEELSRIGIWRDDLELDGYLEPLLRGEAVGPIRLSLTMLGADVELDATIRIVHGDGGPEVSIAGLEAAPEAEIEGEAEIVGEVNAADGPHSEAEVEIEFAAVATGVGYAADDAVAADADIGFDTVCGANGDAEADIEFDVGGEITDEEFIAFAEAWNEIEDADSADAGAYAAGAEAVFGDESLCAGDGSGSCEE